MVFSSSYFFLLIDYGHFYEVNLDHFMNHRNHFALLFYEGSLFIEGQVDREDKDKDKDMNKAVDTSAAAEYT